MMVVPETELMNMSHSSMRRLATNLAGAEDLAEMNRAET
jgi:hypothetical protein